jgi:type IV secretory pathway VirB2 component (pilin)
VLNYHVQGRNARAVALAGVAAMGALLLTGCEDGPECLDYHTQVVPHTTIVGGKLVSGTSIVTTCVQYADEGESK